MTLLRRDLRAQRLARVADIYTVPECPQIDLSNQMKMQQECGGIGRRFELFANVLWFPIDKMLNGGQVVPML